MKICIELKNNIFLNKYNLFKISVEAYEKKPAFIQ